MVKQRHYDSQIVWCAPIHLHRGTGLISSRFLYYFNCGRYISTVDMM